MTNEQINEAIAELVNGNNEDYCTDLNAMHEAEKTLNSEQLHDYYENLELVNGWEYPSSTARQRAEAFLKTLGKWEEQ